MSTCEAQRFLHLSLNSLHERRSQKLYSTQLHRALNVAILVACVFLVLSLVKRYYVNERISGRTISVPGVDFSRSNKTLLLFLRQDCGVCIESLPFYKQLAHSFQDPVNVRLVLITPNQPELADSFFQQQGLRFETVVQAKRGELGVKLSPTLILADASGIVHGSWIGQLSPQQETEIWNMLRN
jgi:thiol-disulfide isomerase/thioredoxin